MKDHFKDSLLLSVIPVTNRKIFLFLWSLLFCQTSIIAQVEIREDWIPLSDSVRLAMDWYLPEDYQRMPRPVILEYLPYRKEEGRRNRYSLFSYFLNQGYLVVRVDIRGTGNSEGQLIPYEYTDQEQSDALEVLRWLSKHPYSSGEIFMMGISWGGFNALQIATHKPGELKGIITMMSTDDLYEDDVHYIDGVMHVDAYEIGQDLANCLPGAPDFVIDSNYFINRFDTKPWLLTYKQQQRDGAFWNRASLMEHYHSIDVPVFAVGGLYDGYRDFIARYFQHADVPITAILGPWNHTFPHWADPPPAIEWRDIAVEWMNCIRMQNSQSDCPGSRLFFYQRDWHPPGIKLDSIPGYWRVDSLWPLRDGSIDTFFISSGESLNPTPDYPGQNDRLKYRPSSGVEASGSVMWWGDWAPDQRIADQHCLMYRSSPMESDLEIAGFPKVQMMTSCTAPQAHWVVRLCDEAPDGRVTLITGAAFNGSHRLSAEQPSSITPGEEFSLKIEMHLTSWTFRKGHRVRLSISNSQWPMLWPSPDTMTMTIHMETPEHNYLILPVVPHHPALTTFELPHPDPDLTGYRTEFSETPSGYAEIREFRYDYRQEEAQLLATNSSTEIYPWGEMHYTEEITHTTNDQNPAASNVRSVYTTTVTLPTRELRWEGHLDFSSDRQNFYYSYTRKLFENQTLIKEKTWKETILRDHH